MKQVVSTSRGEVFVRHGPMPRLTGSGAIVQTICSVLGAGTELGHVRRRREAAGGAPPADDDAASARPMSYQSCGRIVELSEDLAGQFAAGDVVACAGAGFGHHAEFGYVPKNAMARVPEGVAPEWAATCNVGLTALHALRRADLRAGELLAVIGLGMVGQYAAQLAGAFGGHAVGSDLYPLRLQKARGCGVEAAVDAREGDLVAEVRRRSGGRGADSVCVCVVDGTRAVTHLAVRAVRPSGVVLFVGGGLPDFAGAEADASPHRKEIDVRWVYGRGAGSRDPEWNRGADYPERFVRWTAKTNLEAFLHLLGTGRVRAAPLLTHRFPVEHVSEAAGLLIEHPAQALGVVLTYGGAPGGRPGGVGAS